MIAMQRGLIRSPTVFAVITAAALAIAAATWIRMPHGGLPTLSYDGFRYLAGAYSLASDGIFSDIDGSPQRVWPPGTSFLYAALARVTGRAPETLPGVVGFSAYLSAMIALALTLAASVRRTWIAGIAFVTVACNGFIVSMTNKLWSDPIALACLSIVLALLIVRKPTIGTVAAATTVIAIGIAFRYAMIAALPLLLWAAWRTRQRQLVWAGAGCIALLLIGLTTRIGGMHVPPFRDDLHAIAAFTNQLLPAQLGAGAFLIVSIAVVLSITHPQKAGRTAGVWMAAYVAFLFLAQAIAQPSFTFDLRILIPLYPAIAIAMASAADDLWERRRFAVAGLLVAILAVADLRAIHGLVPHADSPRSCVNRERIVAALQARHLDGPVSSNAQGLVWYALRRPVLKTPRAGDIYIAVDPARVCPEVIEMPVSGAPAARVIALP